AHRSESWVAHGIHVGEPEGWGLPLWDWPGYGPQTPVSPRKGPVPDPGRAAIDPLSPQSGCHFESPHDGASPARNRPPQNRRAPWTRLYFFPFLSRCLIGRKEDYRIRLTFCIFLSLE